MMKWIMVTKVILLKRIHMCIYYDYRICFKRCSHISKVFLLFGDEGPGPLGLLLSNLGEHWGVWGVLEDVPAVVVDCLACVAVVSLATVASMDTVTEGYAQWCPSMDGHGWSRQLWHSWMLWQRGMHSGVRPWMVMDGHGNCGITWILWHHMDTVTEGYAQWCHPQITMDDPWHPCTTLWSTQIWMTLIGWRPLHWLECKPIRNWAVIFCKFDML